MPLQKTSSQIIKPEYLGAGYSGFLDPETGLIEIRHTKDEATQKLQPLLNLNGLIIQCRGFFHGAFTALQVPALEIPDAKTFVTTLTDRDSTHVLPFLSSEFEDFRRFIDINVRYAKKHFASLKG